MEQKRGRIPEKIPDHPAVLELGMPFWNEWRLQNPGTRPRLSNVVLRDGSLVKAAFQGADLRGADFSGSNLFRADFRGADLAGANLEAVDLFSADLRGANLIGAVLKNAELLGARLDAARLCKANLEGAYFRMAGLRGTDLRKASLRRADLSQADLCGADLRHADLWMADFLKAKLVRVDFRGANWMRTNLAGADLCEATLEGARDLTVEQLAVVKTLYKSKLDPELAGQMQAASVKQPQHAAQVADLLGGQRGHASDQLVVVGVVCGEVQRGQGGLLFAHGVVGQEGGEILDREAGPALRGPTQHGQLAQGLVVSGHAGHLRSSTGTIARGRGPYHVAVAGDRLTTRTGRG